MQNIINLKIIDPLIYTGGQPNPDQISALSKAGFQVVINLALPSSTNAIPNEGELVTDPLMTYVNIPVVFEDPQLDDFQQFLGCMKIFSGKKIFVHCAKNYRVSTFMYLYRVIVLGMDPQIAEADMLSIWQPDEIWQDFIDQVLSHFGKNPLKKQ